MEPYKVVFAAVLSAAAAVGFGVAFGLIGRELHVTTWPLSGVLSGVAGFLITMAVLKH